MRAHGSGEVARRVALNPRYFVLFFFVFLFFWSFPFFAFDRKTWFPPRKGHFCSFLSVSLCFSLAFLGLPLFQFLFLCLCLCLSLSLSLSLSCSFFLSSFLSFFYFWFLVFVSFLLFYFIFLSFLLLFHERNNIKILNCTVFVSSILSLFWLPVLFSLWNPFFSYLFFFWFYVMFFVQHHCFPFKTNKLKNTHFGQKGGCNKTVFFYEPVFCKMWKVIFLIGHFWGKFWLMLKNTIIK